LRFGGKYGSIADGVPASRKREHSFPLCAIACCRSQSFSAIERADG
jgi:hypothetical protein